MVYKSFFKDIRGGEYTLWIDTSKQDNCFDEVELTLSDTPVTIKTESDSLYAPIKARSCTINIESDGGLFDLYTTDPQGVKVIITSRDTTDILFKGYATPMQYGQDWTTIDTLSLECVDMISTLKEMPYTIFGGGGIKRYIEGDKLICWILSHVADEPQRWFRWYWPYVNYYRINGYQFTNTWEVLHNIKFNEANFFDDDDEQTPWSFYDVLTEICKYFHVSAVPYQDGVHFIDYLYAASTYGTYSEWEYTLDRDITLVGNSKNFTWNGGYVGGTASIETDDFYNIVNENTNRYDLDEIATDIMDHKEYHISITKEKNFGDGNQVYTWTKEHFFGANEYTYKYAFKTFCRLNSTKSRWTHHWYSFLPYTVNGVTTYLKEVSSYYDGETHYFQENNPQYHWINIPENEYINTMGAEIVHYAVLDSMTNRPTKLDWNDVVMFQCAHPAMKTANSTTWGNFMYYDMFDGTLEKEALSYNSDYELCFSPKDGTSWIVFNAKLYYQQDPFAVGPVIGNMPMPIDFKNLTTSMIPFDNLTDLEPYDMAYTGQESGYTVYARRKSSDTGFGTGFPLLKIRLRIGDKYWNGSQWTTTNSTFYMNFAKRYTDKHDVEYEAVRYYDWLDAISNSDYESKVGAEGYCIPIQKSDCVCGDVHIDIFMPMMMDRGMFFAADRNDLIAWYQLAPIVFMKDFKVDYVYTDESEWYLNEEVETDDVKYCNDTKDTYKYEKNNDLKINSWQTQRPISKSFPIVDFIGDGENGNPYLTPRCEYLANMYDYFHGYDREQEYNLIQRELRHHSEPRIIYNANRGSWLKPWSKVQLSDASEIDDNKKFVVDSQEFDVRNANNRVKMIEYGDVTVS